MNSLLLASFGSVMQYILYILLAILVLLAMITVHEFGHYIAGKIFHFGIEEFAIGFGPKIYSKTKKDGEKFSLRCLPVGGFCAFTGEDKDSDDPSAFNNKKPWQRIIVLISGALMNYLLALIILIIMIGSFGQTLYRVDKVAEESVSGYSFEVGDVIVSANGKNVYMANDMMSAIKDKNKGDKVVYKVLRDGKEINIEVEMLADVNFKNVEDTNPLLIAMGVNSLVPQNVRFSFFKTIGRGVEYSFKIAGTIFTVLGQLLTGKLGIGSVGGTITTIKITADAVKTGGLNNLMMIAGFIGVNLAVFNLLPIPALDGSRVVFTLIEWIIRKPLNRKVEGIIHFVGIILLLGFAVLVDLLQIFV